jgi:hypothetical protein
MEKSMNVSKVVTGVVAVALLLGFASNAEARGKGNPHDGPVIYVTNQGLYYDAIVTTMLPQKGPFQQLFPTDDGLETEFGPGDRGYVGGRWWLDLNPNGEMDDGDLFFSCPLLGPGRLDP